MTTCRLCLDIRSVTQAFYRVHTLEMSLEPIPLEYQRNSPLVAKEKEEEECFYMFLLDNKSDQVQQGPVTLHHIMNLQEYCLSVNAPGTTPIIRQYVRTL